MLKKGIKSRMSNNHMVYDIAFQNCFDTTASKHIVENKFLILILSAFNWGSKKYLKISYKKIKLKTIKLRLNIR